MVDTRQSVLDFISSKGPALPIQIGKTIGKDTFLTGAILSEMARSGKLKISSLKVGGSPLYYVEGQEAKLENFVDHLKHNEREAFNMLNSEKVIKDSDQKPLVRFSLRQIKDFAVPIEVEINNNKELFWKWYALSNDEIKPFVKKILEQGQKEEAQRSISKEDLKVEDKKEDEVSSVEDKEELIKEHSESERAGQSDPESEKTKHSQTTGEESDQIAKDKDIKSKLNEEKTSDLADDKEEAIASKEAKDDKRTISRGKDKEKKTKTKVKKEFVFDKDSFVDNALDPFLVDIKNFFEDIDVEIIERKILKDGKEIEFLIEIPSALGYIEYYCRAFKKKPTSKQIEDAYVQGQVRKLPTVVISSQKISARMKKQAISDYKGLILKSMK